jgi:23S rRNA maturation-related 3'-5' exoribonuclease YhaM
MSEFEMYNNLNPGSPYEDNRYLFDEGEDESMKERIIELLKSTCRPDIYKLIEHMEEIGFFTAPCSSQYHLAKDGGLAEHSLNVYDEMRRVGNAIFFATCTESENSIIISSLLHDLGKASYRGKPNYIPNILASGKISDKKPFETNKDLLLADHA